jgi:hypothetical protein
MPSDACHVCRRGVVRATLTCVAPGDAPYDRVAFGVWCPRCLWRRAIDDLDPQRAVPPRDEVCAGTR